MNTVITPQRLVAAMAVLGLLDPVPFGYCIAALPITDDAGSAICRVAADVR
jgi:hypothetical protein